MMSRTTVSWRWCCSLVESSMKGPVGLVFDVSTASSGAWNLIVHRWTGEFWHTVGL